MLITKSGDKSPWRKAVTGHRTPKRKYSGGKMSKHRKSHRKELDDGYRNRKEVG
jgi:hypothetical protein